MAEATLVPPGGQYVQTLQAVNHLIDGQVALTATIDNKDLVTEPNETNNTLTRTLSCSPSKPDLALVSLELDGECRARLTIRNVGTGTLGNAPHGTTLVYRKVDGASKGTIRLADMDPSRSVSAPNGSVTWTDWAEFKPTGEARYSVAVPTGSDANTANNEAQVSVPERCKAGSSAATPVLKKQLIRPKLPVQGIHKP